VIFISGSNDKEKRSLLSTAGSVCFLRSQDARFDGFAEANFIGQIAPLESGELNANRAASIWCGFQYTWGVRERRGELLTLSEGQRRVSACAKYWRDSV